MKHSIGTSTGTIIHTRQKQYGNVLCKNCKHLKYSVRASKNSITKKNRIVYGDASSYICEISGEPKAYTTRCYCKNFKAKN